VVMMRCLLIICCVRCCRMCWCWCFDNMDDLVMLKVSLMCELVVLMFCFLGLDEWLKC